MNYTSESFEDIIKWLKTNLTEEKFCHSIGTMQCAEALAKKFNLDVKKAVVAGLLHDCAKNFDKQTMQKMIDDNHIEIFSREKEHFKVLHAPLGCFVAHANFGVTDEQILSAIRFHTIARKSMSDFEKIIFIADKIEKNTREKELSKSVILLLNEQNGLNKAMIYLIERTVKYLKSKQIQPDDETLAILDELKSQV